MILSVDYLIKFVFRSLWKGFVEDWICLINHSIWIQLIEMDRYDLSYYRHSNKTNFVPSSSHVNLLFITQFHLLKRSSSYSIVKVVPIHHNRYYRNKSLSDYPSQLSTKSWIPHNDNQRNKSLSMISSSNNYLKSIRDWNLFFWSFSFCFKR